VAFLATLETSTRLIPLPLMRRNLLSLGLLLLHLLSRCTVLGGRCLVGLLRLTERMPTQRLIGHSPDNVYLLSLRVTLQSLHGNNSVHYSTKSLVVSCVQLLLQIAREATIETVPLLLLSINMSPSIL